MKLRTNSPPPVSLAVPPGGRCRGRFAPTPSGPLHLGSLLTALAGWLCARAVGGQWLLRIDDLDAPRCVPGADSTILRQLEAHALHWDGVPRYQSAHADAHASALQQLAQRGLVYPCTCTRAQLARSSLPGPDGPVYAGTCRPVAPVSPPASPAQTTAPGGAALRLRTGDGVVVLHDRFLGQLERPLPQVGDFVVRRADGIAGYQLASVVDDLAQGVTEVVRGADLLGSSLRQKLLFELLGAAPPAFGHVSLVTLADGRKLSKQNGAPALDGRNAPANVARCLQWLGLGVPPELAGSAPAELLDWARARRLTPAPSGLPATVTA